MCKKMICLISFVLVLGLAGNAFADTITVGPSGDYSTIQEGINAATGSDTVLVADGTYTGTNNKNLSFGGKAITVISENGPANCIIDCEDSGRGFLFNNSEGADSVLSGFTISNANTGGTDESGGGIFCENTSPTITNCIISSCDATGWGGGIYCNNSDPNITNCKITDSTAVQHAGAIYCFNSSPTITNCTFVGNAADVYGGAINCYDSAPTITNCTFTDNNAVEGGGLYFYNYGDPSPTVTNCTISGNWAQDYGGGLFCEGSDANVINCTITGNTMGGSGQGGGIYLYNADPTIVNCAISGNAAGAYGGGIHTWASAANVTNCIVWDNTPVEISPGGNPSPSVTYCDVKGGFSGTGNINEDPEYVDVNGHDDIIGTEDDNLRLFANSPCIGAGTSGTDIGAYQYDETSSWMSGYQTAKASKALPSDGATAETDADDTVDLIWLVGYESVSHDVYLGTDYNSVANATHASGEYKGRQTTNVYSSSPDVETPYYWAIDAVNDSNSVTEGDVWSFTAVEGVHPYKLFSDGFESGGFGAGGWSTSNSTVSKKAAYTDTFGALINTTGWIEKAISTEGYADIHLKCNWWPGISGQTTVAEWSTGAGWNTLETSAAGSWSAEDWNCPSGADDKSGFKIRFRGTSVEKNAKAYIDDVEVVGQLGGPSPGVTITETDGSTDVNEAGPTSDTYTVVLDLAPSASVTITVDPDIETEVNNNGSGNPINLTFTTGDWESAQTVTVTAIDDNDIEGNHTSTITHSASSSDADYNDISIVNVVANVTDNDECSATTMHVESIVCTTVGVGQGRKIGRATVIVHNDCEETVADANVTGTFTGDYDEQGSDITDGSGVAVIETVGTAGGNVSFEFCVTGITHATLTYNANDNEETCDTN